MGGGSPLLGACTVDFIYVGAHDLLSELTKPRHAGRVRYWFNASVLSPDGLKQRLATSSPRRVAGTAPRFTSRSMPSGRWRGSDAPRDVGKVQVALGRFAEGPQINGGTAPKGDEAAFKDPSKVRRSLGEGRVCPPQLPWTRSDRLVHCPTSSTMSSRLEASWTSSQPAARAPPRRRPVLRAIRPATLQHRKEGT